jgi:prophage maintenance system killer protein
MSQQYIGRPRFVTTEEALAWQETAIAQYGGAAGMRDPGLLESALAQPRQAEALPFAGQALLLIDIYRIAEDMGYEW